MRILRTITRAFVILSAIPLATSCLFLDGSFHDREITAFSFTTACNPVLRKAYSAEVNADEKTIRITLPDYVDLSTMVPSFDFDGVKVLVGGTEQVSSESAQDFSSSLSYSVLGLDDETTQYRVEVSVVPPSSDTTFSFLCIGSIYQCSSNYYFATWTPYLTTNFSYSHGPDLTNLYVSFLTNGVSVAVGDRYLVPLSDDQASYGSVSSDAYSASNIIDFTGPVDFLVTAEDGTQATYTAHLTRNPSMSTFQFSTADNPTLLVSRSGIIGSDGIISVEIPDYVDATSLVARFSFSGEDVSVGGVVQTSGVSENDFSADVEYLISGAYGSGSKYTVEPTIVKASSDKALQSIQIGSIYTYSSGSFSWTHSTTALVYDFPYYSSFSLYSLYVVPTFTGVRFSVVEDDGNLTDLHASSEASSTVYASNYVDFSGPVTFRITAEDGSTRDYTAAITVASR